MSEIVLVKVKRKWAVVVNYDLNRHKLLADRTGCWCKDKPGGWGIGRTPEQAVEACYDARTYRTKEEALKST